MAGSKQREELVEVGLSREEARRKLRSEEGCVFALCVICACVSEWQLWLDGCGALQCCK